MEISSAKLKRVRCPMFRADNETIIKITQAIDGAQDIKEKVMLAEQLLNEVEGLLKCEYFDKEQSACRACRAISKIRKKTAKLILKVGEIKPKKY